MKRKYCNHYEETAEIHAPAQEVFLFADNHHNLSSHMNTSSGMMGGGKMITKTDDGKGQKLGSHIMMTGEAFGINVSLDEVITIHDIPTHKEWETVGKITLVIIDHYALGFTITPHKSDSQLTVYIDYNLPKSWKTKWLGFLLGDVYAKWCVRQMIHGVQEHFEKRGD